ncbi:probable 4-coumarate--CoA ligase 2 isoform X2 [Trichoplusia ni]|uniref:Probable 4-coumarate--CoA ligase 2 isoform X2 n=1 Tax=Trichoplusia ni TaxID=7111 RepID=A0A7E5VG35_TRINI|nr:probable 4-coumarate--CoA ligase 2 isoform X2 [Trichoplusia ni]
MTCQNNYHLGHMLLDHMRSRPDAICQIDAATGKSETNASVLSRAVRLARCLRRLGAQPGDLLALHGRNHLDLLIPFYAALFNGLTVFGVDPTYKFEEIKNAFRLTTPKVAFCQCEHVLDAVTELGLDTKVVTFSEGALSMQNFIREYDDNGSEKDFRPAEFDVNKIYVCLITTSGTTGAPKLTAHKQKFWIEKLQRLRPMVVKDENARENRPALSLNPVQWISAFYNAISMPLFNVCIIKTSLYPTADHIIDIINEYRKRTRKDACAVELYALTETLGEVFSLNLDGPIGSAGKPNSVHQLKLVDPDTEVEITEPNTPGHLLIKGPLFVEYYKNPEQTAAAFTSDGWYKSGDLFYRDKDNNYFFVERIGMLIRYRNHFIVPVELVEVIRQHPGVLDVSVTYVTHRFDGEHPVACVVRRPGYDVTAHEIKELVANKLSYHKRLRGGVIFMNRLPRTSTGKEARAKLQQIARVGHRE